MVNTDINIGIVQDKITVKVAKLLLENPEIPYPATTIAQKAGVAYDPVNRRIETWQETGLMKEAETGSSTTHYTLNPDSSFTKGMRQILDSLGILTGEQ